MRSEVRAWFLTLVCGGLLAAFVLPASAQAIGIEKLVATNCTEEECGEEFVEETEEIVLEKGAPVTKHFEFNEPKAKITVPEAEAEGFTQAGGRVPFGITDFQVASIPGTEYPEKIPTAGTEHIPTDVAPRLAPNPFAVPMCSPTAFEARPPPASPLRGSGLYDAPTTECAKSVIGFQEATTYTG